MEQKTHELTKSFDSLAHDYDEATDTFHHQLSAYVTTQNLLLELPKNRTIKILDSGGGTGMYTILLRKLGYDVTLSDISPESVKVAERKAEKENIRFETKVCDSEKTGFPAECFDFVMMNGGVISYTPNPARLIKEAYRILKTGGLLWFDFLNSLGWAIETIDSSNKAELALEEERLIRMPDWDYPARLLRRDKIAGLLRENNFRIKSTYGLISLSHSLSLEKRYSKEYGANELARYQRVELELSRRPDCTGASWSCSVCAIKE